MIESLPGPAILFCPGDRPERFSKATAAADAVIFDLEDAVAPDAKSDARDLVASMCGANFRHIVRVNALASQWHEEDIARLRSASGGRPLLMLPKTAHPSDLRALADFRVVALIETARGVLNAAAIAVEPNCVAMMWGAEDLVADLGGQSSRSSTGSYYAAMEHARSSVLLAAAAAEVPSIDSVFVDIADLDGLRDECRRAVDLGYRAKACIHPSQVAVVREGFRPDQSKVQWATRLLAAADQELNGVFMFEGRMVDMPLLSQARAVLGRSP